MSSRDNSSSDPRYTSSGRDPRSEQRQTSQARPSRDDHQRPLVYNPPGPPYQVPPPQPPYNTVPAPYAHPHPPHFSPHALAISPQAFPSQPSQAPSHALVPPQAFPSHSSQAPSHGFVPPQAFPQQRHDFPAQGIYAPPFQPQSPPGSIAESGNTENSSIGGSYNNNSTRTDHRVSAHVFIQNLLHVAPPGRPQPATGHPPPAPVPSSAFPSIPSGQSARPMDHLTAQMRETTITSSRYESHSRVPSPDDADFDNRYPDQSRNKQAKTKSSTIPGPMGKDEYDYKQGQRGHPGEGSSRSANPRVEQPSQRPDPRSSQSIPIPTQERRHDYSYDHSREPSRTRMDRESSKGDKYSQKPPKDMFNPYSSSSHPTDPRLLSSQSTTQLWADEDSSDESGSSSGGSGSETAAPSPKQPIRGRKVQKTRTKASTIPTRPPLDIYQGSSGPSGLSTSRSQQPTWVAEPSSYTDKGSAPIPIQRSASRDPRSREDTDFVVGSYRGEVGVGPSGMSKTTSQQPWSTGQPAAPGDSQTRSSRKEERDRYSTQQSSGRSESRVRGTDDDYRTSQSFVGSYRGEVGGISGRPSDSQGRSRYAEGEGIRSSVQQSSSRPDPRSREIDDNYGVSSYGGGGGGFSGNPSDSQKRSGYQEKESARLPVQQSSSRDPRGKEADTDFVVGSYRSGVGVGPSGMTRTTSQQSSGVGQPTAPGDSQTRSKEKEKDRSTAQQSSSRPDPRIRGSEDYGVGGQGLVGGYRGGSGGSGHPSDSQSRSAHKERESTRSSAQQSSSRQDPRAKETDTGYVVGSQGNYRGEVGGAPSDSQSRSGQKERESTRSSAQQSTSRQDPRPRGTDEDVAGGQAMSGGSSKIPYTGRDRRPSITPSETMDPTAHSSRSPSNPTTSIPQRKEEDHAPYNTRGSGRGKEGSSQPADPSRTNPYGPYSSTDTARSPQYEARYSHPSQVQSSLGSQRPENTLGGEPSRSSGRDPRLNPPVGATMSQPRSGQPTAPAPGWPAHPPHPGSIVAPPMTASQSYPFSQQMSRHGSAGEGDKDTRSFITTSTHPGMQRKLTNIIESQIYNPSQQTLSYKTQPLGNPCLVPFIKGRGNENLGLSKNVDSHIPLYMCSNIIDPDTIAFWFPAPTLFPPSGGRRGVQLGDLGYFDDSGEFRPIFNIFRSYEQNIAEGARPPSQPYQPLHIDRTWIRQVDIQRQQTYTSSNIEKRGEVGPHTQSSYQFRTYKQSGRSGAIIVLPHGGGSSCIRNSYFQLPEVKRHFRDHAPSWYQHALPHIPKKNNGSLILVRATHCARSWGIAAFASKRDIRDPLTATFMSHPANEYQQMWQTNDSKWKTSTGPSSLELKELGGREPPLNQCVGVVISSLRLDDATWQANFESMSSPPDRGGVWGLRRVMSRDSWSTIHVNENAGRTTRRLLDSIRGRPTDARQASGGDDYTLLLQEP